MASCEKCWSDAYMRAHSDSMKSQAEVYQDLLQERIHNPCTAEEQAGEDATECPKCKRMTAHQYTKSCVVCGYKE